MINLIVFVELLTTMEGMEMWKMWGDVALQQQCLCMWVNISVSFCAVPSTILWHSVYMRFLMLQFLRYNFLNKGKLCESSVSLYLFNCTTYTKSSFIKRVLCFIHYCVYFCILHLKIVPKWLLFSKYKSLNLSHCIFAKNISW